MRGCFGGCTFCSITIAHQGRIIQSRSQESILREVKSMSADPEFGVDRLRHRRTNGQQDDAVAPP
ncbi:MAG: radical SAM protein [Gemmataceae bacterium]